MNIISYKKINTYIKKHANSKMPLLAWYKITLRQQWKNFDDVKKTFNTVDRFKGCTIFNIGGNNYRLIAGINYETHTVYIKQILTHAEYDKDNWKKICDRKG
ncbi:MAG: type II toxin-antitoxin system HigB family toxin [Acidobacteriota bacterium]|nr:MAG: type II toxin-antitoxin system HigB family toxin [Acidobacteriota bacterium]